MSDKIQYEIKIEKSVKIILGAIALGLLLNAFSSSIYMELFGAKEAMAELSSMSFSGIQSGLESIAMAIRGL